VKAVSGIAPIVASLLVACATAQSVDGSESIVGNVTDGGQRRDSTAMPPEEGGSTSQAGAGGTASTASGGTDPGSSGGAVDSSGGSGGTMPGDGFSGGAAGESAGGHAGGAGGAADGGGATQGLGGACAAGQKLCTSTCVTQSPSNGCSATSCTACPIPAPPNGLQLCDAQGQCNFECLSGYQKNGTLCTTGGGGTGGGGSSGTGGEPTTCGNDNCHRCLGNLIGCCNKQGDHCLCVFQNQMDQCG